MDGNCRLFFCQQPNRPAGPFRIQAGQLRDQGLVF